MIARLIIRELTFAYAPGAWTLSIPRCEFGSEQVVCLVGPNGSGKSTLLKCAAGLLAPASGSVLLGDDPISALPRAAFARRVGYLPQEVGPLFSLRVDEVAALGRYPHHPGWRWIAETDATAIDDALAAVEMTALRDRPFDCLSGGERRRALLASLFAQQPDLMLLDEPTAALDPHHALEVMRVLRAGPRVVMATHDLNLASLFADRIVMMHSGRIVADGSPESVLTEGHLECIYGPELLVGPHPVCGLPMVLPRAPSR